MDCRVARTYTEINPVFHDHLCLNRFSVKSDQDLHEVRNCWGYSSLACYKLSDSLKNTRNETSRTIDETIQKLSSTVTAAWYLAPRLSHLTIWRKIFLEKKVNEFLKADVYIDYVDPTTSKIYILCNSILGVPSSNQFTKIFPLLSLDINNKEVHRLLSYFFAVQDDAGSAEIEDTLYNKFRKTRGFAEIEDIISYEKFNKKQEKTIVLKKIITKYYSHSLCSFSSQPETLSIHDQLKICLDILYALDQLHSNHIIHGNVQAQTIVYNKDKSIVDNNGTDSATSLQIRAALTDFSNAIKYKESASPIKTAVRYSTNNTITPESLCLGSSSSKLDSLESFLMETRKEMYTLGLVLGKAFFSLPDIVHCIPQGKKYSRDQHVSICNNDATGEEGQGSVVFFDSLFTSETRAALFNCYTVLDLASWLKTFDSKMDFFEKKVAFGFTLEAFVHTQEHFIHLSNNAHLSPIQKNMSRVIGSMLSFDPKERVSAGQAFSKLNELV